MYDFKCVKCNDTLKILKVMTAAITQIVVEWCKGKYFKYRLDGTDQVY